MIDWDSVDFGDITCQQFVELVTDYLEDELDDATRRRFETHLAGCPGCARYLDQIRETQRALGRVQFDSISDRARAQLMTAFRGWRSSEPGAGGV
jgi:anti-sigma factor RsiW